MPTKWYNALLSCMLIALMMTGAFATDIQVSSKVIDSQVSFQAVNWQQSTVLISGTNGSAFISKDNGKTFNRLAIPKQFAELQFRDNHWWPNNTVVLMSAGDGADSQLLMSTAPYHDWQRVYQGRKNSVFFDCMAFNQQGQGWLYGDAQSSGLYVLHTNDAGASWQQQSLSLEALPNEGGFASSGTCVAVNGNQVVVGTGNSSAPSLLLKQGDKQWQRMISPFDGGESAGIFSVQLQSHSQVVYAFGGSLKHTDPGQVFRYDITTQQWRRLPTSMLLGAIYGSALYYPDDTDDLPHILISNPNGVAVLRPRASEWERVSHSSIWSVTCSPHQGCIGVGNNGVVEHYLFPRSAH